MMTSSNGNIFCVTGPLWGEFTGHRWFPRRKASDAELWYFLWSAPWINGWVYNHEAGDLRRHRFHYDVIVMMTSCPFYPSTGCWTSTGVNNQVSRMKNSSAPSYSPWTCTLPEISVNNPHSKNRCLMSAVVNFFGHNFMNTRCFIDIISKFADVGVECW